MVAPSLLDVFSFAYRYRENDQFSQLSWDFFLSSVHGCIVVSKNVQWYFSLIIAMKSALFNSAV